MFGGLKKCWILNASVFYNITLVFIIIIFTILQLSVYIQD